MLTVIKRHSQDCGLETVPGVCFRIQILCTPLKARLQKTSPTHRVVPAGAEDLIVCGQHGYCHVPSFLSKIMSYVAGSFSVEAFHSRASLESDEVLVDLSLQSFAISALMK